MAFLPSVQPQPRQPNKSKQTFQDHEKKREPRLS